MRPATRSRAKAAATWRDVTARRINGPYSRDVRERDYFVVGFGLSCRRSNPPSTHGPGRRARSTFGSLCCVLGSAAARFSFARASRSSAASRVVAGIPGALLGARARVALLACRHHRHSFGTTASSYVPSASLNIVLSSPGTSWPDPSASASADRLVVLLRIDRLAALPQLPQLLLLRKPLARVLREHGLGDVPLVVVHDAEQVLRLIDSRQPSSSAASTRTSRSIT